MDAEKCTSVHDGIWYCHFFIVLPILLKKRSKVSPFFARQNVLLKFLSESRPDKYWVCNLSRAA